MQLLRWFFHDSILACHFVCQLKLFCTYEHSSGKVSVKVFVLIIELLYSKQHYLRLKYNTYKPPPPPPPQKLIFRCIGQTCYILSVIIAVPFGKHWPTLLQQYKVCTHSTFGTDHSIATLNSKFAWSMETKGGRKSWTNVSRVIIFSSHHSRVWMPYSRARSLLQRSLCNWLEGFTLVFWQSTKRSWMSTESAICVFHSNCKLLVLYDRSLVLVTAPSPLVSDLTLVWTVHSFV